ncbi:hypothetical protein KM043_012503 [Ampulex compressa]|nr:hypothetical protein KM043_012503 [Ampulex compressa]
MRSGKERRNEYCRLRFEPKSAHSPRKSKLIGRVIRGLAVAARERKPWRIFTLVSAKKRASANVDRHNLRRRRTERALSADSDQRRRLRPRDTKNDSRSPRGRYSNSGSNEGLSKAGLRASRLWTMGVEQRGLTLTDVQQTFPIILNSRKSTDLRQRVAEEYVASTKCFSSP